MRRFAAAAASFLFLAAYVLAQDSVASSRASVVLLSDGRLLSGEVTKSDNRYHIKRSYGTIELSGDQVLGVFPDRHKAYEFQRSQLSGAEAEEYVRLAFWCLRYKLFDEARDCVRQALSIEPSNRRLRRLLSQIDQQERLAQRRLPKPNGIGLRPAAYSAASGGTEARPIPQQAIQLFARRIQPLVSRRCAAASCHGPRSKTSFRLWPSMYPAPAVTHYNVRQLARYIDWQSPEKSPLLIKAIVPHGGGITPPLPRRQDDPAFSTLYEWVKVLVETDPLASDDAREEAPPSPLLPAPGSSTDEPQHEQPGKDGPPPLPSDKEQAEPSPSSEPKPQGPPRTQQGPQDPFDPGEFNRRFYEPAAGVDHKAQDE